MRRPVCSRAVRRGLPGERRRPGLRGRDRRRRLGGRRGTIFAENLLGGTCARVCPVEALCRRCVLVHEGRAPIAIGLLQRYATDWAFSTACRARGRRPTPWPWPWSARARQAGRGRRARRGGYTVTVFDERDGSAALSATRSLPIASRTSPCRTRRGCSASSESTLGWHEVDSPPPSRSSRTEFDAILLGVGMGGDVDVKYEGDELDGVWGSLPFIRAIKTGKPPAVGHRVAVVGGGIRRSTSRSRHCGSAR